MRQGASVPWPSGKARVCKTLIPRFKSGRHLRQVGLLAVTLGACHRQGPAAVREPAAAVTAVADSPAGRQGGALLRPIAGYLAGAVVVGEGWTRRRYVRQGAVVEVTVAVQPMTAAQYQEWERQAADYPAARLVPPASGFFTCAGDGGAARCDLHVQTPAGLHLELLGGGRATRADLEQVYAGLAWK